MNYITTKRKFKFLYFLVYHKLQKIEIVNFLTECIYISQRCN